jgi:hypothetical protein
MPFYRRIATQVVHPWLFSLVAFRRITDSTNGFRGSGSLSTTRDRHRSAVAQQLSSSEHLFKAIRLGYNVREVPVTKSIPRTSSAHENETYHRLVEHFTAHLPVGIADQEIVNELTN